jgi:hypothetical protein
MLFDGKGDRLRSKAIVKYKWYFRINPTSDFLVPIAISQRNIIVIRVEGLVLLIHPQATCKFENAKNLQSWIKIHENTIR